MVLERKTKKCLHCDADFNPKRDWQKFCSTACKNHYHLHLEVGAMKDINCSQCGHNFKQIRRCQKFCSKECRSDYHSQLAKKLKEEYFENLETSKPEGFCDGKKVDQV